MTLPIAAQRQNLRSIDDAVCATIGSSQIGNTMTGENTIQEKSAFKQPSFLKDLIQRSRAGDSHAMGSIYEHFKSPMFGLAYRYSNNATAAEDLIQEIFPKFLLLFLHPTFRSPLSTKICYPDPRSYILANPFPEPYSPILSFEFVHNLEYPLDG